METLMIIGGTGSLGHCFVKKYFDKFKIIIVSRDENKQWKMKKLFPFLTMVLCDIRHKENLENVLLRYKPNRIIIAAALKHIDICENNINECILTNITGIQNIIDCICENISKGNLKELECVIFTSTDKAVSPVNVYGMCKSVCERLMAEKSLYFTKPKFITVRYGNVLYSRGSLFQFFKEIGNNPEKKFFPVTDTNMTRFFIKLEESVELILKAMSEGKSGDTYIPKLLSYRIIDIAKAFSEKYNKPIKIVGVRPGEKLHECLINESEKFRTIQEKDTYIIKPCYTNFESSVDFLQEYTSAQNICENKQKIIQMIT